MMLHLIKQCWPARAHDYRLASPSREGFVLSWSNPDCTKAVLCSCIAFDDFATNTWAKVAGYSKLTRHYNIYDCIGWLFQAFQHLDGNASASALACERLQLLRGLT